MPGGHGQKVVSDFVMLISCFCGWICDRIVLDMLCVTTFLSGLILRSQWRGEWWRCHSFSSSSLTSLPQEPAMTSSTSPSGTLVGWKLSIGCCHRILCDICWSRCFGSFYSVIANTSSLFFFPISGHSNDLQRTFAFFFSPSIASLAVSDVSWLETMAIGPLESDNLEQFLFFPLVLPFPLAKLKASSSSIFGSVVVTDQWHCCC